MENSEKLQKIRLGFKKALTAHPAALVMLLYCFLLALLHTPDATLSDRMFNTLFVAPVCIVLSLVIESFVKNGWAWAFLVLLPFFAVVLLPGTEDLLKSAWYWVITGAVTPLAFILSRRSYNNDSYVRTIVWNVWAFAIALLAIGILTLLIEGICWATVLLFPTIGLMSIFMMPFAKFSYIVLCPLLFFIISDKEEYPSVRKLFEFLINWIVTPALIIYSAVLLIYIFKIVFTWSLPCGGVAIMCLIWGILAVSVSAAGEVCETRHFAWFDVAYKYLAIPFVGLLWVSISRRIGDYGITPSRYYLVLSAVLMMAFLLASVLKRDKIYYKMTAVAAAVILSSVIVPGINYHSVTLASQKHCIKKYAKELNILSDDGTLAFVGKAEISDWGKFLKMRESIDYLLSYDKESLDGLGKNVPLYVNNSEYAGLGYEGVNISAAPGTLKYSTDGFSKRKKLNKTYTLGRFDSADEYCVESGEEKICVQDLLDEKMKAMNAPANITESFLNEHKQELLVWDVNGRRYVLSSLTLGIYGRTTTPQFISMTVEDVLIE